jgi:lambda repressor-like predicted transcriptional regulator
MHSTETKNQFIELRAQGRTLASLASQLGVSKRTLIDWNRQSAPEIQALRAVEIEALHEKILASHEQELTRLGAFQRKLDDELANRAVETIPTDKLLRLSLLLRREIRALCESTQIKVDQAEPISPRPEPSDSQPSTIVNGPLQTQIKPAPAPDTRHSAPPSTAIELGNFPSGAALSSPSPTLQERVGERRPSNLSALNSMAVAQPSTPEPSTPQPSDPPPSGYQLSTIHHQPSQEHCLHCGDPLPPLLPDRTRPSPWCVACRSPIAAPPGFSIRELCPVCAAPIPVHGYNIKRWSGQCPECSTNLPNLDVNAPLKWLPPASELQSLASAPVR